MLCLAGDVLRFVDYALELQPQQPQALREAKEWLLELLQGFRETLLRRWSHMKCLTSERFWA